MFGKDISEKALTPEYKHLLNVDIYAKELNDTRIEIFHSVEEISSL